MDILLTQVCSIISINVANCLSKPPVTQAHRPETENRIQCQHLTFWEHRFHASCYNSLIPMLNIVLLYHITNTMIINCWFVISLQLQGYSASGQQRLVFSHFYANMWHTVRLSSCWTECLAPETTTALYWCCLPFMELHFKAFSVMELQLGLRSLSNLITVGLSSGLWRNTYIVVLEY